MSTYRDKRTGKIMLDPETSQYVISGHKNAKKLKECVEKLKCDFARFGESAKRLNESLLQFDT